ncbi:c-type cytochrome [Methylophaga sp.]|uniref:c-type cytochrome n=1 Tax=Methylophaga sp. TaxID=2024840 RepID=UPI003F69E136
MTLRQAALLSLCLVSTGLMTSLTTQAQERPYTIKEGNQLDADTYNGFKLYRNWCARCHGTYGQGLAGPDLTKSLNQINRDEFMSIVADGKSGSIGSMPAWRSNSAVMKGRDNIYSYLKARANGDIGSVKPELAK